MKTMILKTKFKVPDDMTADQVIERLRRNGFGNDVSLFLSRSGFKLHDPFLEVEERGEKEE